MLYNYIALVLFVLLGIFIPVSFLMTAKILGRKYRPNDVKDAPYESGEKVVGSSKDIDSEYFPFIMLFLPFEVVAILALVWSYASGIMSRYSGLYIVLLLVFATVFSLIGYRVIGDDNGE
ncbi:NADH-quinone oxidoreductase subunit A [Candidatus Marsarchaeota archaeon]|nr:NADH-quinone oxidoreductase subunit A [Candidatus Marsarchaeota archaeon]